MALQVCETFYSLLGESTGAGPPAFFIRLTGCNLRCHYCDTAYAYEGGRGMSQAELLKAAARIVASGLPLVPLDGEVYPPGLLSALPRR